MRGGTRARARELFSAARLVNCLLIMRLDVLAFFLGTLREEEEKKEGGFYLFFFRARVLLYVGEIDFFRVSVNDRKRGGRARRAIVPLAL